MNKLTISVTVAMTIAAGLIACANGRPDVVFKSGQIPRIEAFQPFQMPSPGGPESPEVLFSEQEVTRLELWFDNKKGRIEVTDEAIASLRNGTARFWVYYEGDRLFTDFTSEDFDGSTLVFEYQLLSELVGGS